MTGQTASRFSDAAASRNLLLAAVCVLSGALIILLPAILIGRPFIFWDTPTFYSWGHDVVAAIQQPWPPLTQFPVNRGLWAADNMRGAWHQISADQYQLVLTSIGARSKFYAVPLYLLGSSLGLWAVAAIQAFLVSWLVWVTTCLVVEGQQRLAFLAVIIALTIGTSAPFYATFMMPDIFGALGLLALALLLCLPDRLTSFQRAGCVLLLIAAILVHMANLPVFVAVTAIVIVCHWLLPLPKLQPRGLLLASIAAILALAAAIASDAGMQAIFGQRVRTAPFLEGRVIADGPGQSFLREACGRQNFAACIYKDAKVTIPDDIIWPDISSGLPLITDPAERRRYLDEQPQVVLGTILSHPLAELRAALGNGLRQIADFRISNSVGASLRGLLEAGSDRTIRVQEITPNLASCISWQPRPCDYERPLHYVQFFHYTIVTISFLVLALHLLLVVINWSTSSRDRRRIAVFALTIAGGVIANGLICGALSGPWQRYQARLIWLVPMAAGLTGLRSALAQAPSPLPGGTEHSPATPSSN